MSEPLLLHHNGQPIGRMLTREEFCKLNPGNVYDDLMSSPHEELYLVIKENGEVGMEWWGTGVDSEDYEAADRFIAEQMAASGSDLPSSEPPTLHCNGEPIGRMLTREEFCKLDPSEVYDALMSSPHEGLYLVIKPAPSRPRPRTPRLDQRKGKGAIAMEWMGGVDNEDYKAADRFVKEQMAAHYEHLERYRQRSRTQAGD